MYCCSDHNRIESNWKQKSKETWLLNGDHNTKYSRMSIMIKRRQNTIHDIKDVNNI